MEPSTGRLLSLQYVSCSCASRVVLSCVGILLLGSRTFDRWQDSLILIASAWDKSVISIWYAGHDGLYTVFPQEGAERRCVRSKQHRYEEVSSKAKSSECASDNGTIVDGSDLVPAHPNTSIQTRICNLPNLWGTRDMFLRSTREPCTCAPFCPFRFHRTHGLDTCRGHS